MPTDRRLIWVAIAGLAVLAALLLTSRGVQRQLAPKPLAAWVAIQTAPGGFAEGGPVTVAANTPFTLHVVLEAEVWGGQRVYYSEAQRLRVDGREVEVRPPGAWAGDELRILWFTVEGFSPYLEVAEAADLERFHFEELFRADWAQGWSVPGTVAPAAVARRSWRRDLGLTEFGTQRYHVRVEIFGPASRIVPRQRLRSAGAVDLPAAAERFPTVTAVLPGALSRPSRSFGLTQIEVTSTRLGELGPRLAALSSSDLAFSRPTQLRAMLDESGAAWDDLRWAGVDLRDGPAWGGDGVAAGDLLRVGERIVVLVRDVGETGRLDESDLVFDFFKGARLGALEEVFTGEGLVEWAPLAPRPAR